MHRYPLLAALLLVAGLALANEPAAAPEPATALIDFTIEDQFEVAHTQAEFAGKVMVLVWADRKGSDHLDRWMKTLERKLKRDLAGGGVELRRVAHVAGVPGFIKGRVRDRFGDDPDGWALMDWDGVFAAAYAMTEDHCNLLVFGADGALLHHGAVTGLDQAALDGVLAAVAAGRDRAGAAPGLPSTPTVTGVHGPD